MDLFKAILLIGMSLLTLGCGYQHYFEVENNTDQIITLEFSYDSILLKNRVADYFIDPNRPPEGRHMRYSDTERFDDINLDSLFAKVDSIPIHFLFPTNTYIEAKPEYDSDWYYHGGITVSEYFASFPEYLKRIKSQSTVTMILPPQHYFQKLCEACADCSCGVEFPEVDKLTVVIEEDDYIVLTRKNFRRLMEKVSIDAGGGSYTLVIN